MTSLFPLLPYADVIGSNRVSPASWTGPASRPLVERRHVVRQVARDPSARLQVECREAHPGGCGLRAVRRRRPGHVPLLRLQRHHLQYVRQDASHCQALLGVQPDTMPRVLRGGKVDMEPVLRLQVSALLPLLYPHRRPRWCVLGHELRAGRRHAGVRGLRQAAVWLRTLWRRLRRLRRANVHRVQ